MPKLVGIKEVTHMEYTFRYNLTKWGHAYGIAMRTARDYFETGILPPWDLLMDLGVSLEQAGDELSGRNVISLAKDRNPKAVHHLPRSWRSLPCENRYTMQYSCSFIGLRVMVGEDVEPSRSSVSFLDAGSDKELARVSLNSLTGPGFSDLLQPAVFSDHSTIRSVLYICDIVPPTLTLTLQGKMKRTIQ